MNDEDYDCQKLNEVLHFVTIVDYYRRVYLRLITTLLFSNYAVLMRDLLVKVASIEKVVTTAVRVQNFTQVRKEDV